MPDLSRLRRRVAAEDGFTMVIVIAVLVVLLGVSFGAYAAVSGDTVVARHTDESRRAYAAAEAGLGWYRAKLAQDPTALTSCTNLDNPWDGTGSDPRTWRQVDSSDPSNTAQFAIEAIPANGNTACVAGNESSMIDTSTGTVRLRITGRARPDSGTYTAPRRSIVATLRRKGFLDYLYLTDYESVDPPLQTIAWRIPTSGSSYSSPDFGAWAATHCVKHYTEGRDTDLYNGQYTTNGGTSWNPLTNVPCAELKFSTGDTIAGPFHTNDSVLVCGAPTFGASATDSVEVSAAGAGAVRNAATDSTYWGCASSFTDPTTATPAMRTGQPTVSLPTTNSAMTAGATHYRGKTTITFNANGTMDVVNANLPGGQSLGIAQPAGGVIWVSTDTGGCGTGYNPLNPGSTPASCGDLTVKGTYTANMTLTADNDIAIAGDLVKGGSNDPILGLVASNYVRVMHPLTTSPATFAASGACTTTTNAVATGTAGQIQIQAAILALQHSFIVDNWACPFATAGQQRLSVTGVIAQKFRGPTNSGSQATGTGYWKDYTYDQRLKYRSPPHFLDPVGAAWKLLRVTELTQAK